MAGISWDCESLKPCPFDSELHFVIVIFFKNAEKTTSVGLILSLEKFGLILYSNFLQKNFNSNLQNWPFTIWFQGVCYSNTRTCLLKRIVLFMHSHFFAVVALFFTLHFYNSVWALFFCVSMCNFLYLCVLGSGKRKKELTYNTISWVGN